MNLQFKWKYILARYLVFGAVFTALIYSPLRAQKTGKTAKNSLISKLKNRSGTWDVIMTFRPTPDTKPIVMNGTVERTMIDGVYLKEVMRPAPDSNMPEGRRISYLNYNKIDNRWEYINMDTRFPGVGIMSYQNFGSEQKSKVTFYIKSFVHPGFGPEQENRGQSVRLRHVMIWKTKDRDIIQQFWTPAGGEGQEWLAVKYEYTRK